MLGGQFAVVLSCSDKFRQALAWPVRDALAAQGLRGVIVADESALPGSAPGAAGKLASYLDAASAFVALCPAEYGLSDGTLYPRSSTIDEIQAAVTRPHLRDRCQVLAAPGVLLPSSVSPTFQDLDPAQPGDAAKVILAALADLVTQADQPAPPAGSAGAGPRARQAAGVVSGVGAQTASPASGRTGAGALAGTSPAVGEAGLAGTLGAAGAADLGELTAALDPYDPDLPLRRAYDRLLAAPPDDQRRLARALHQAVTGGADETARLGAAALLEAVARLDPALVPAELAGSLAASPGYQARACAARLLRDRAVAAPGQVPVALLGRLAVPSAEDWYVWAPALAAVKELALARPAAQVVLVALADGPPQDRHAAARALLDLAETAPDAVAAGLARRLLDDPDPLVAETAAEVVALLGSAPALVPQDSDPLGGSGEAALDSPPTAGPEVGDVGRDGHFRL
jgi:hypothetical protein